jgi:hypothetical protein
MPTNVIPDVRRVIPSINIILDVRYAITPVNVIPDVKCAITSINVIPDVKCFIPQTASYPTPIGYPDERQRMPSHFTKYSVESNPWHMDPQSS